MGADRKGPLAAFVVVTIIAAVLLITSVRSQAAPGIFGRPFPVTIVVGPPPATAELWGSVSHRAGQAVHQGMVLAHKAVAPVVSDDPVTESSSSPSSSVAPSTTAVHTEPRSHPVHHAPASHPAHHVPAHHPHTGPAVTVSEPADVPGDDSGHGPSDHSGEQGDDEHAYGDGHHGRDHSYGGDDSYGDSDGPGDSDSHGDGQGNSHWDGDGDSDGGHGFRGQDLGWPGHDRGDDGYGHGFGRGDSHGHDSHGHGHDGHDSHGHDGHDWGHRGR